MAISNSTIFLRLNSISAESRRTLFSRFCILERSPQFSELYSVSKPKGGVRSEKIIAEFKKYLHNCRAGYPCLGSEFPNDNAADDTLYCTRQAVYRHCRIRTVDKFSGKPLWAASAVILAKSFIQSSCDTARDSSDVFKRAVQGRKFAVYGNANGLRKMVRRADPVHFCRIEDFYNFAVRVDKYF